jgi:glycosyltransferase involved in cell wall biosynthesis
MALDMDVSVIIPTYNRREFVCRAVESVLAQTHAVPEIIVVDDGSTDGTDKLLRHRFGSRVQCVRQSNAGVSSARNHGLRLARGRYLCLLDSDDEWAPEKTRLQLEWLEARPDFGMVLCDVMLMDAGQREVALFRRRDMLPHDGLVLPWVLMQPALCPTSVMMRREVFESIGGFDESLPTAEDIDFHLRVAARWPIGVVEQPLARATGGHDGLSSLARTYDDHVGVIERAVAAATGQLDEAVLRRALARAYARNARGMVVHRRWGDALALARKAWSFEADAGGRLALLLLALMAARRAVTARRAGMRSNPVGAPE